MDLILKYLPKTFKISVYNYCLLKDKDLEFKDFQAREEKMCDQKFIIFNESQAA